MDHANNLCISFHKIIAKMDTIFSWELRQLYHLRSTWQLFIKLSFQGHVVRQTPAIIVLVTIVISIKRERRHIRQTVDGSLILC